MEATFSRIHEQNVWANAESVSGPGSTIARAADFIDDLVALLKHFNWAGPVADAVEQYIGLDVVSDLIVRNQHASAGLRRRFMRADLTADPLPQADVILCRDCLVHFSFQDIVRALHNFQHSGSRYVLTTTFIGRGANDDIATGAWRPLDLQAPPFALTLPLAVVDEKCMHTGGIYRDKRLALWTLATLPTLTLV